MSTACLNTIGITLTLIGVLMLFRYGMPYRVRTDGAIHFIAEQPEPEAQRLDRVYAKLGWVGLEFILAGAVFQLWATWN